MSGAALAGMAVGGAAPFMLPDHPDAKLIALCAQFEALQRKVNGNWCWPVNGVSCSKVGYIEDDEERADVVEHLEAEAWPLHLQIFYERATTIEGMRAKVRCLLLADPEVRDIALDVDDGENGLGLAAVTSNLIATLLQDLSDGSITDATCTDVALTEVRP